MRHELVLRLFRVGLVRVVNSVPFEAIPTATVQGKSPSIPGLKRGNLLTLETSLEALEYVLSGVTLTHDDLYGFHITSSLNIIPWLWGAAQLLYLVLSFVQASDSDILEASLSYLPAEKDGKVRGHASRVEGQRRPIAACWCEAHYDSVGSAHADKPSYISPRTFALALFDTLAPTDSVSDSQNLAGVRGKVAKIQQNDDLRRALLVCMDDAEEDLGRAHANMERWFEEAM